jgi:4-amino-4-deoxy-L-arabinose transferase-like glycosyltransferase
MTAIRNLCAWFVQQRRYTLTIILLAALVLRIGFGVYQGFNSGPDRDACGADTEEFEHMAWSLAQGKGLVAVPQGKPTAFRAPGYPVMLAALYAVFGRAYFVNRIALSLVGTATCALVYLLALRMRLGVGTALSAALLTAVLPLQFYYCAHFMSEPPAACLNVVACLLMLAAWPGTGNAGVSERAGPEPGPMPRSDAGPRPFSGGPVRISLLFAAGIACGLSAVVRPVAVLVPAFLGLLLLAARGVSLSRAAAWTAVFGAGAILAVAPVTVRNVIAFDRFCLIASNGGAAFWGSNNAIVAREPDKWGTWITTNFDLETKQKEVWALPNEIDRDRKEWELGVRFIREHPGLIPVLAAGKLYRLLKPFPDSPNRVYAAIVGAGQMVMLPLSTAGLVIALAVSGYRRVFLHVFAQLLALLGAVIVFYGSERFRCPYEPFLAILAALALRTAASRLGISAPVPGQTGLNTGADTCKNSPY